MISFWEVSMSGEEKPMIVPVRPNLVDSAGRPLMHRPEPPPDPSWHQEINADTLFHKDGHWFEIVGISQGGIVCRWKGPTKKNKWRKVE